MLNTNYYLYCIKFLTMSAKPHIFLVEDDLSFGAVLKSYLEINDFEVEWVDDGKNA